MTAVKTDPAAAAEVAEVPFRLQVKPSHPVGRTRGTVLSRARSVATEEWESELGEP